MRRIARVALVEHTPSNQRDAHRTEILGACHAKLRRSGALLIASASCATLSKQSVARKRLIEKASFDLACSRDELKVVRLADDRTLVDVGTGLPVTRGAYMVRGCGNDAQYIVDCSGDDNNPVCAVQQTNDVNSALPAAAR